MAVDTQLRRKLFREAQALVSLETGTNDENLEAEFEPFISGEMDSDQFAKHLRDKYLAMDAESTNNIPSGD